jgi:predicted PurR-regulated permease PerM
MGETIGREPGRSERLRTVCLVILTTIAVIAALYFGSQFFVPLALALLLNTLLRPVVRWLEHWLPTPVGAAIVVLLLLAIIVGGTVALADPVQKWARAAPASLKAAQDKIAKLRRSVQGVSKAAQELVQPGAQAPGQPAPVSPAPLTPALTSLVGRLFGTTTAILGGIAEVLLLLYLLLASGDLFLRKLVHVLPLTGEKRAAVEVVSEVESAVSRYIATAFLIYLCQGIVVGLVMWLLGMPSPALWGGLTVVLEFIPYIGALIMIGLLTIVAIGHFEGIGRVLMVPGAYFLISTLQANLVSPVTYGRRLRLNPVAVLVGVLFWWVIWGVPGAFLAVPFLASLKILADHVEGMRPVAEFLGE